MTLAPMQRKVRLSARSSGRRPSWTSRSSCGREHKTHVNCPQLDYDQESDGAILSQLAFIGRGSHMISLADCIAMCGLTEAEVLAIAEHEHIPEIAAAALANYLLSQEHGPEAIRNMIRDDIRRAIDRNDREHARELFMALRHFSSEHPIGSRGRP